MTEEEEESSGYKYVFEFDNTVSWRAIHGTVQSFVKRNFVEDELSSFMISEVEYERCVKLIYTSPAQEAAFEEAEDEAASAEHMELLTTKSGRARRPNQFLNSFACAPSVKRARKAAGPAS